MSRARRGFTLIEMVILVVTTALVGSVLAITIIGATDSYRAIQVRKTLERDAWGAMERMRRAAERLRSCTLEDALVRTVKKFQFRDASLATVTIELVGPQILYNGVALLGGVSSFSFSYLDENAVAATRVGDIRRVVISFTVTANGESLSLRSEIEPRSATFPFCVWSEP